MIYNLKHILRMGNWYDVCINKKKQYYERTFKCVCWNQGPLEWNQCSTAGVWDTIVDGKFGEGTQGLLIFCHRFSLSLFWLNISTFCFTKYAAYIFNYKLWYWNTIHYFSKMAPKWAHHISVKKYTRTLSPSSSSLYN